jgi:hypothetical protein
MKNQRCRVIDRLRKLKVNCKIENITTESSSCEQVRAHLGTPMEEDMEEDMATDGCLKWGCDAADWPKICLDVPRYIPRGHANACRLIRLDCRMGSGGIEVNCRPGSCVRCESIALNQ